MNENTLTSSFQEFGPIKSIRIGRDAKGNVMIFIIRSQEDLLILILKILIVQNKL